MTRFFCGRSPTQKAGRYKNPLWGDIPSGWSDDPSFSIERAKKALVHLGSAIAYAEGLTTTKEYDMFDGHYIDPHEFWAEHAELFVIREPEPSTVEGEDES